MPSSNTIQDILRGKEKRKEIFRVQKVLAFTPSKYYKRGPTPITPMHVRIFPYISCSIHVSPLDHKAVSLLTELGEQ